MKAENYFTANRDLAFSYENVVDWDRLVPFFREPGDTTPAADMAATWRDVLGMAGAYIGKEVSARAAEVDRLGTPHTGDVKVSPPMAETMAGLADLGLIGLGLPREYGGEGLPLVVQAGVFEMLARADSAAMVQYAFYTSPAAMIVRYGAEEQKHRWVPRLSRGEIAGWVAMTEPEAGSDVGNVSTAATRRPDGTWRISGRKQFISSGNGDVGIVLARAVPGSKDLDGLALFVVPRCVPNPAGGERLNVQVERAEEKVCITGSPTCALSFEGSEAEIMGYPGDGWRQITSFMNEARVVVGIQACGVAQAALTAAQDYAAQRVQMDKPIREHPLVAQMLIDMETTVAGLRAFWLEAAATYDVERGLERRIAALAEADPERERLESRRKQIERYLRELTPLVKYFGAEEAIRVARTGMQVFGGYGVVKEYEVERHLRDSLILPIYEGTSQIQALMAVKDLFKAILRTPLALLGGGSVSPSLAGARFSGETGRLYQEALGELAGTIRWLMLDLVRQIGARRAARLVAGGAQLRDEDLQYVLLSAERLTQMLAHLHIGRLLARQAERWPQRRRLAQRFMRRTVDVCHLNARQIKRGDRDTLEVIREWRATPA